MAVSVQLADLMTSAFVSSWRAKVTAVASAPVVTNQRSYVSSDVGEDRVSGQRLTVLPVAPYRSDNEPLEGAHSFPPAGHEDHATGGEEQCSTDRKVERPGAAGGAVQGRAAAARQTGSRGLATGGAESPRISTSLTGPWWPDVKGTR